MAAWVKLLLVRAVTPMHLQVTQLAQSAPLHMQQLLLHLSLPVEVFPFPKYRQVNNLQFDLEIRRLSPSKWR